MPKIKRNRSVILDRAATRAAAISTIAPTLELGGELTLAAYQTAIANTRTRLADYNTVLTSSDTSRREFEQLERGLADLSDRMLAGVGSVYGKNSAEYAKAGGVPKSERKRRPSVAASAPITGTNAA